MNEACELAKIDRITPNNIDLEDMKVWNSIREDTSLIFQVNTDFGLQTMRKLFSKESYSKIQKEIPDVKPLDVFAFSNALLRPCGKSVYDDATQGIVRKTGVEDIDKLLGSELGYPLMQETQMQFLMQFCGYSFLQADAARKKIAKRLGTRDMLPDIEKGFNENAKVKYNLSDKKAKEIVTPFNQCILDATRYSFCRAHAYSYSLIGYMCGYLRYYYPYEYLTACFNTWLDKREKIQETTEYAHKLGIRIQPPIFRYGQTRYSFDKDTHTIYKGMKSIKYMNEACCTFLYSLRDNKYESFTQLLYDLYDSKSIDTRQIEILIKLDFFKEFGNIRELLRIKSTFEYFKNGKAKNLSKTKLSEENVTYEIVKRNSKETAKTFTQMNVPQILSELEELVRTLNIPDFSLRDRIETQREYLGYFDLTTGSETDRMKIVVLEKRVMISKRTGKPWGVSIEGQSLGSGKRSQYTIFYDNYQQEPFNKEDVIQIAKNGWSKKNNYFYINRYQKIYI
jgi:DNA polymerase-3 subunit alpha